MKYLLGLILIVFVSLPLQAQTNARIKELEKKRSEIQKQIEQTQSLLTTTNRDVKSQLNSLSSLNGQIEERKRYIGTITDDIGTIDRELTLIRRELGYLERQLSDKKSKYAASLKYLQRNKTIHEKLLFILSASTLEQTYRRLRYVREYATYQRLEAQEIVKKQEQIELKKEELEHVRVAKEDLLKEREQERIKLERQEKEKRNLVADLQKRQKGLQAEIQQRRKQADQLNNQIDKLVAEEIEKARKRAEEEAHKERKAAAAVKPDAASPAKPADPMAAFTLSKADRELSGSFVNNRGKLPVPLTGPYVVVSKFGQYNAEGLRNVKLDNKGIDIQGRPGAEARAIFDGEVTAVFQLNGLVNVLIRHGNYISVYCNLSSTTVKQGDKVKTRQVIGPIFSNPADNNRTVLHFQLRKETEKLNPEPWLDR